MEKVDKDNFFKLDREYQKKLVQVALIKLVLFESANATLSHVVLGGLEIDVMKVVLGAFMNGEIN